MNKLLSYLFILSFLITHLQAEEDSGKQVSSMVEAYKATVHSDVKFLQNLEKSSEESSLTPLKKGLMPVAREKVANFNSLLGASLKKCTLCEWPFFCKDYGFEKFMIQFPAHPIVTDDGFSVTFIANDTSIYPPVIYGVTFHSPSIIGANPDFVFNQVISARASLNSTIAGYQIVNVNGYWILDILSFNLLSGFYQQERVIVTPYDVYFLFSLFYPNSPSFYQDFFNSFTLF